MSAMASQITGARLFTQLFAEGRIRENTKAPRLWHFSHTHVFSMLGTACISRVDYFDSAAEILAGK